CRIDPEMFAPDQPPDFLAGGPGFQSEEELAYELGYRHREGALALSVATFYSRYHGLRSLEQTNPPAATPIVIGNGQDGESYGAELTADYRVTDRWRLRAGTRSCESTSGPTPAARTGPGALRSPTRPIGSSLCGRRSISPLT